MSVAAQFETDLLAAFPTLPGVVPAVYRPKVGGDAVGTYVMVEDARLENDGRAHGEYAVLRVPMRDVPEPAADDAIEAGGETWEFRVNQDKTLRRERSWPFWKLQCRRKGSVGVAGGSRG